MKRRSKCVIFKDIYEQPYSDLTRVRLTSSSKSSLDLIQRLSLLKKLPVHNGCVNSICWNETGEYILSGSDDQHLVVTHGYNYKVLTDYKTSHRANIFSAKFLPNSGDNNIISCSGDGIILYTDLMRKEETYYNQFNCHSGTTYEVITIPNDPNSFLSCGEDGTVRWFDLRVKDKCNKPQCKEDIMITCQRAVTALSVNPIAPYQLAIGCSDSTVRMFDRRMLGTKASGGADSGASLRPLCSFTVPSFEDRSYRITSLTFSPEGEEVLVSYSSDHLYLFSVKDHGSMQLKTAASSSSSSPDTENGKKPHQRSPPPVRRLRLRGDWSDTGPDARPEREGGRRGEVAQARPTLHATLMQRMTDVLSRMLNDPATRAALSGGGEDSLEGEDGAQPASEAEPLAVEEAAAPSSSGSISVPHLSSLSINSSPEAVESSPAGPSSLPEPSPPEEFSNALDLSQVPQTESSASLGTSPGSELIDRNITNLQDQLSTMREGFIERHGSEPAVNLVYSEKSSTGATISLGLGDEVSRKLRQDENASSSAVTDLGASTSQGATSMEVDSVPGPSQTLVVEQQTTNEQPPEAQPDAEEEYNDSDDEVMIMASRSRRFIHPIEEHMDEAIAAARHDKEMMFDEQGSLQPAVKQKYVGHRNARTMIKEATFWGSDYVLSGSDCGHVFIWNRYSGELVMLLEADHHVVNCLQPHPVLPMLATSGIDYDVKLWAPVHHEPNFNTELADTLTKRNEVMLEETKDTITVPASFMIRMLACLNQIRRGGRGRSRNTRRNPGEDSSSTNN